MIGSDMALGDVINADVQSQAARFGLKYTMWRVANHFNHIHICVLWGDSPPTSSPGAGAPSAAAWASVRSGINRARQRHPIAVGAALGPLTAQGVTQ